MDIKYTTGNSGWGLQGFFQGQRLVFSAQPRPSLSFKQKWQKFLPFGAPSQKKNPNSIIGNLDLYTLFSPGAKRVWGKARQLSKKQNNEAGVENIFIALLKELPVKRLLKRLDANSRAAEILLNNYLKLSPPQALAEAKKLPFEAYALSVKLHNHKIDSLMLLGALLKTTPADNILQAIFTNIALTEQKLEVYAVSELNLNFEFPEHSTPAKLLYCYNRARSLEGHFGYFYQFSAIEEAVKLSSRQTFKDMAHIKALGYLVKAGLLAKNKNGKIISGDLIKGLLPNALLRRNQKISSGLAQINFDV